MQRVGHALLLLCLLAGVGLWMGPGLAQAQGRPEPRPELGRPGQDPPRFVVGQILVKFTPGATGQEIAEAHRRNGGQVQDTLPDIDVQVVRVPAGQEQARVAAYRQDPRVQFAELDGLYFAITHGGYPNDQQFHDQWPYRNTSPPPTGGDINAYEAWTVQNVRGNSAAAIAVLDTGIDLDHPDLPRPSKVTKTKNFSTSSTADDRYGHGTHVAGSAAAATNNQEIGVAGTCPECPLFNVKVLSDDGGGAWSAIANGINWAAKNGAKAINMSFGAYARSSTVELAVNNAWGKGVVLVGAAGNDGRDWGLYPGAYDRVIAVGATDRNDQKAAFSNFGNWVEVAAPGADILSTAPNHPSTLFGAGVSYARLSGTSMASPHVAGLAGLLWASGLCSSNSCIRQRIEQGANTEVNGTGTNDLNQDVRYWSYGRIDAQHSLGLGP